MENKNSGYLLNLPKILFRLIFSIVDLDPKAVRVLEIDLLYAVYPAGIGIFFTRPAFEGDIVLLQAGHKIRYGRHGKAEVGVFIVLRLLGGAGDDMQVRFRSDEEPGMTPVVKGLGDGVQANDISIEVGAYFQVYHVEGNVVYARGGLGCGGLCY